MAVENLIRGTLIAVALTLADQGRAQSISCSEEQSRGFRWTDGKWVPETMHVSEYLIVRNGRDTDFCRKHLEVDGLADRTISLTDHGGVAGSYMRWGCYEFDNVIEVRDYTFRCQEVYHSGQTLHSLACTDGAITVNLLADGEFSLTRGLMVSEAEAVEYRLMIPTYVSIGTCRLVR